MNIANVKGLALKGTLGALALGAFFFAGTAKAQAQWAVGVQFGAPGYASPQTTYYADSGYYERDARREAYLRHEQREAMERREAWIRHEQREHARDYDRRAYGGFYDRDDRRSDRDNRAWR
jgi:hypothetical protein